MVKRYIPKPITLNELLSMSDDATPLTILDGGDDIVGEMQVPVAIMCDLCKHVEIADDVYAFSNVFGEFSWSAGFGSPYDGNNYELDVCNECIHKFGTLH